MSALSPASIASSADSRRLRPHALVDAARLALHVLMFLQISLSISQRSR